MKNKGMIIFIICYLAYTSIYIARLNLSMASPGLIDAGMLDSAQIGMMGSVFSVIYAFGRLLNGGLSDTTPPWRMISTGLLVAGVSNVAMGFFPPFMGMLILWSCNAFAQSMLWSSVLCVVTAVYGEQKAKKMAPYLVTSVAVGNILGILINTYIISVFGLNFAFVIPGALTLIMGVIVVLSIRKVKSLAQDYKKHLSIKEILQESQIRTMIIPAMLHGVMKDNISLWMAVYFVDKFGIDLEKSAMFILFIPIIGFVGRTIYPLFFKLCSENEHKVSVIGFVICVISSIPLALGMVNPLTASICLSLIYAAVSLINTSILSIFPIRFIKTGNVASISGIMDFATYLGAGIGSFVFGFVIKVAGYSPVYFSWAAISIVSLLLLRLLMKHD